LALWIAGLSIATSAFSAAPEQATCPPQAEAPGRDLILKAREQAADRGYLWRISRGGRESYLYGSLHAGRPEWFALGPQVEAALHRTGALALEINVADPTVVTGLQAVLDGPPRALPAGVMRSLRTAWRAECLPEADLDRGPVELHVTQLAMAQAQRQGLFALYGAESVLLMHSLRAQRPVVGLETLDTQLAALLARNDAEALAMVSDGLAELQRPQSAGVLERLVRAWERNDLAELERYPLWCDCVNTPTERESFARLTDGRNPGMVDALERLHAQVSVFAAVGALHLVGPGGLPALLQARGFTVTRVF
jgi:uncharacterized protein YbaP (TraB family)